jgi:hypothetical protein
MPELATLATAETPNATTYGTNESVMLTHLKTDVMELRRVVNLLINAMANNISS